MESWLLVPRVRGRRRKKSVRRRTTREAYHEGAVRGLDSPGWGRAYTKLRTWSSCREPTHAPGSAGVARNLNKLCEWSPRQFPGFYLELWLCWMVTLVGDGEGGGWGKGAWDISLQFPVNL